MIIPMLCVTIFVILVVWFLLPRVARLMIHTPTAISIFVCLSMVQDRKSGSAGMPRPISYAVFCLKKKKKKISRADGTKHITCREKEHGQNTVINRDQSNIVRR